MSQPMWVWMATVEEIWGCSNDKFNGQSFLVVKELLITLDKMGVQISQ